MNTAMNQMGDKETVNDFIASQKQIAASYNTFAGECVNEQLRSEFLCILDDEHQIQADLFNQANSRGWYQVKQADTMEINQARQKYPAGQQ